MKIIKNDQIAFVKDSCNTMHGIVNRQIKDCEKQIPVCEDEAVKKKMLERYAYELAYKSGFNQAIEIINNEFKLDLPYIEA